MEVLEILGGSWWVLVGLGKSFEVYI